MSTNIGKTSATVTANSQEFTSAFKQCEAGLSEFVKSVNKANSALEALQHEEDHAAEHGHGFLAGMLEFEALHEGFEIAKELTVELVKGAFEAVAALQIQSEKTGIATDALSRLQVAAKLTGVDSEGLSTAIIKLQKNLSDIGIGGGKEAAKALEALGLSADELRQLRPEEQIEEVSEAFKHVAQNDRARVVMELFGKAGADLIPVLREGKEGLEELFAISDRTHNTVSPIDAEKVHDATRAVEEIQLAFEGVGKELAIELAPYVKAIADGIAHWAEGGVNVKAVVDGIVEGIAFGADVVNGLLGVIQGMRGVLEEIGAEILNEVADAASAIEYLYNKVTGSHSNWSQTIREMANDASKDASEAFKSAGQDIADSYNGTASTAVKDFFDTARDAANQTKHATESAGEAIQEMGEEATKGQEKVAEQIAKMKREVEDFGLTEAQKKVRDLSENPDATAADVEAATALQEQLDGLKEAKKATEDAQKAADEYYKNATTPAEKYADEVERINKLLEEGYLDAETASRAQEKAAAELAKTQAVSQKDAKTEGPRFLEQGSQAAATFIAQIQRNQRGANDPAQAALKKQDTQIGLAVETRDATKSMASTFAKLGSI